MHHIIPEQTCAAVRNRNVNNSLPSDLWFCSPKGRKLTAYNDLNLAHL